MKYILSIDQGSTSTRIVVLDEQARIIIKEHMDVRTWCEGQEILQNPEELYQSVYLLIERVFDTYDILPEMIQAIGITNQRETTVLWNRKTNQALYPAISWQSKHTQNICETWYQEGYESLVKAKTGLTLSPYFSASKIRYILNKVAIDQDTLCGTIDSYLLYRLTNNHKTDVTNASRTMLYNIHTQTWDQELLEAFEIPESILPEVFSNDALFGYATIRGVSIPVHAMIGDQQSALYGHQCFNEGDIKNTYGTGCFMLMNTGKTCYQSKKGLLSTIAWRIQDETTYALEGSVFMGGSVMKWMKTQIGLVDDIKESAKIAQATKPTSVYLIPAFVGLGTPYWDNDVRGAFLGLEMDTKKEDLIQAALNSIAYQVSDLWLAMKEDTSIVNTILSVDGGASKNTYLMQFQSNIMQQPIYQLEEAEATSLGAGYLAGIASGLYKDVHVFKKNKVFHLYYPNISQKTADEYYRGWQRAVRAASVFKNKQ